MGRTRAFRDSLKVRSLQSVPKPKSVQTIKGATKPADATQHDLAKAAAKSNVKVQSKRLGITLK